MIWGCGCGMGAVLLVALLLGGGIWYAMGRSVSAPAWLRSAIEARLAEALPGTEVDFGDLRLRLQPDWLARIALTDVELRSTDGTPMLTLGLLEAGLAPTKLLQGEYELRVARVSGVQLTARRDAEGRLTMGFDELFGSGAPRRISRRSWRRSTSWPRTRACPACARSRRMR
uniref:AsmA domain-containing protein n=1 Tax=Alloyangia mangrovi TaxID=1779329 RepID=A0A2A3JU26_9RHOB